MTITGLMGYACDGSDEAATTHQGLLTWVSDVAALTRPAEVRWCDGTDTERERLTHKLVDAGTFIPQELGPSAFRCVPDPQDVAELGRHTYLCTRDQTTGDPTINWMEPVDMRIILTEEYRGCMAGRTMYVVPFHLDTSTDWKPMLGVQITDSEYVVVAMHLMSELGTMDLKAFGDDAEFVRCVHSVGAPRRAGQLDVPWPCDHTKYTAEFPETRTIWSYGSGFASNALLGTDLDSSQALLQGTTTDRHLDNTMAS